MAFAFRNMIVYQKGLEIVEATYSIVKILPAEERYALCDQLRRAAVSITSNIAEGLGRESSKEQAHFIDISYGSLMEVLSQLDVALQQQYIDAATHQKMLLLIEEEAKLLSGLRSAVLKRSKNSNL